MLTVWSVLLMARQWPEARYRHVHHAQPGSQALDTVRDGDPVKQVQGGGDDLAVPGVLRPSGHHDGGAAPVVRDVDADLWVSMRVTRLPFRLSAPALRLQVAWEKPP
jgi:hypothetical protein